MDTDSFIVYIKRVDINISIAKDVKALQKMLKHTSNHKSDTIT